LILVYLSIALARESPRPLARLSSFLLIYSPLSNLSFVFR
jgi:hypothetical protein